MNIYIEKTSRGRSVVLEERYAKNSDDEKSYERLMLIENNLRVFYPLSERIINDKTQWIYDIGTSLSIYELSKKAPLKYDELCLLVTALKEVRDTINEYLLSIEGLILDPEFVFYDRTEKRIRFCFYPWYADDVFPTYKLFSEFLLTAIDYSDQKAVDFAYEIYASILNKDYQVEKLIKDEVSDKSSESQKIDDEKSKNVSTKDSSYVITESLCDSRRITTGNHLFDPHTMGYRETDNKIESKRMQGGTNELKLSKFSKTCITLFLLVALGLTYLFFFHRVLFLYFARNMKIMSAIVLFLCFLLYFPIMNMSDIIRARKTLK